MPNDEIPGGYYLKARCIKNSWIAHAPPIVREVWDYLLREANHSDKKYNGYTIKRGQLFRTYQQIREALHWKIGYRIERYHESSMKRAMKALMNEGMIELTSEPRGNIITVLNYDRYQDPKNYERTDDRTKTEPRPNQDRTKTEPAIYNKNEKNENNTPLPPKGDSEKPKDQSDFDLFWKAYPKKKAKQAALKAWSKTNKVRPDIHTLLRAIESQAQSTSWHKEGGQFIPHPATWLNGGCWDDEQGDSVNSNGIEPTPSDEERAEFMRKQLERLMS